MIPGKHQKKDVQKAFVKDLKAKVEKAKKTCGTHVVLSFDPMHQIHNNENGYLWQKKGREGTKRVPSNTGRKRLTILGAIDLVSNDIIPLLTEANCDTEMIKAFLDEVKKAYPRAKVITMYLDNARYQRNYAVQDYAQSIGITLTFMPPYSPNLCLIERVWKFFKKKVISNTYYAEFDDFFACVCTFFREWDFYKEELESLLVLNFEII